MKNSEIIYALNFGSKHVIHTIIVLLFFGSLHAIAQDSGIDSLKQILRTHSKQDTDKVNLLLEISDRYFYGDHILALNYAQEAISLATKLHWTKGEIKGYTILLYTQTTDRDFPSAVSSGLEAMKIAEATSDSESVFRICSSLGDTYRAMGESEVSEAYLTRALMIARKNNNHEELLKALVDLDNFYTEANQFDKAEAYEKEALPLATQLQEEELRTLIMQMSAERKYSAGKVKEAISSYRKELEIWKAKKNYHIVAYHECRLGEFYADLKMKDSAYYFANAALELSRSEHLRKELNDSYECLYYLAYAFHDYESALKFHLTADSLEEADFNEAMAQNAEKVRLRFEQDKKDAVAKAELQKQKMVTEIMIAGALGMLLFGGYFIYNLRLRRKLEALQLRNKISADLHDEIGSTLSSISVYSDVARKQLDENSQTGKILHRISETTTNTMEAMSDIVWSVNPKHDAFENLTVRMQSFASRMLEAKNIEVKFSADEKLNHLKLGMDERQHLYLIFKEAVNNIAKYSCATKTDVELLTKGNELSMKITDNGKGFNENDHREGNGLHNMRMRSKQLNGQLKIESESGKGTRIIFSMKNP